MNYVRACRVTCINFEGEKVIMTLWFMCIDCVPEPEMVSTVPMTC